jgi:hypothetical protein
MATVAVIGDVGGCAVQLAAALERLDADTRDAGDMVVIQVGDLVQLRMDTAWRGWIQLAGNHEAQYIGG